RIEQSPRLTAIVKRFRGSLVDTSEAALRRAILDGESWAVRFVLATLGEDRGYGKPSDSEKPHAPGFLEKSGHVTVQMVLRTLIEHDDYVAFCRAKHQVLGEVSSSQKVESGPVPDTGTESKPTG